MNNPTNSNGERRERRNFTWVFEILLAVAVIPALAHGVLSLNNLPVV